MASPFESLTDEQLLNAQRGDFSSISDEQLLALQKSTQSNQGLSFSGREDSIPKEPKPSAIGLMERIRLSFADDEGRKQALEEKFNIVERLPNGKFAVGDTLKDIRPIDPTGMFNDVLGDVADVVAEIPVVAGQIFGATVAGVPGAAGGAATGQVVKAVIGRAANVRKSSAFEEATDVALVGALGAAGEGAIQASKLLVSKFAAPVLTKAFTNLADKSIQANPSVTPFLTKLFRITAKVPEDATRIAGKHGFNETFKKPFTDPKTAINLSQKVQQSINSQIKKLGDDVNNSIAGLSQATKGKPVLDLKASFQQLTQDLQQSTDLLLPGNFLNPNTTLKGSSKIIKLLKQVGRVVTKQEPVIGQFGKKVGSKRIQQLVVPNKKFTVNQAVKLRRISQDLFDDLSPQGQKALFRFNNAFDDFTGQPTRGLLTEIQRVATEVGDERFLAANANFKSLSSAVENFKKLNGVQIDNLSSMENFVKGFLNKNQAQIKAFEALDNLIPTEFLAPIEKFASAQAFANSNPDLLRLGAVLSFVGLSRDESFEGRLGRLGLGLALTTPAGAKLLLKSGEKAFKSLKRPSIPASLKTERARKASGAILTQLLRQNIQQPSE